MWHELDRVVFKFLKIVIDLIELSQIENIDDYHHSS
jgi:hypothetical protein